MSDESHYFPHVLTCSLTEDANFQIEFSYTVKNRILNLRPPESFWPCFLFHITSQCVVSCCFWQKYWLNGDSFDVCVDCGVVYNIFSQSQRVISSYVLDSFHFWKTLVNNVVVYKCWEMYLLYSRVLKL